MRAEWIAGREAGEEEYRDESGKMIQENGDESGQTIQEGGNANERIKEGINGGLDESSLSEQTESGQLHEERAASDDNLLASGIFNTGNSGIILEKLNDYDYLMKKFYNVHPTTTASRDLMQAETFLSTRSFHRKECGQSADPDLPHPLPGDLRGLSGKSGGGCDPSGGGAGDPFAGTRLQRVS